MDFVFFNLSKALTIQSFFIQTVMYSESCFFTLIGLIVVSFLHISQLPVSVLLDIDILFELLLQMTSTPIFFQISDSFKIPELLELLGVLEGTCVDLKIEGEFSYSYTSLFCETRGVDFGPIY